MVKDAVTAVTPGKMHDKEPRGGEKTRQDNVKQHNMFREHQCFTCIWRTQHVWQED